MKKYFGMLALFLIGMNQVAHAGVIYNVSRSIGDGSVTGFIETDGTIGSVNFTNITNWSLSILAPNINGGVATTSNLGNGTYIQGSPVTATASQLFFNFGVDGIFGFFASPNGFWCLAGGPGGDNGCFLSPGESIGYSAALAEAQFESYTGVVAFASVANTATVPGPGTLFLLPLGLAALLSRRRRHA